MTRTPAKDSRLAVRLTNEQRARIDQAALAEGRTVTEFAVAALAERAEHVLADRHVFPLTEISWARFTALLDSPPQHNTALADLLSRDPQWER